MDSDSSDRQDTDDEQLEGTPRSADDSADDSGEDADQDSSPASTAPRSGERVRVAMELLHGLRLEKAREAALELERDLERRQAMERAEGERSERAAEKPSPSRANRTSFDHRTSDTVKDIGDIMSALDSMHSRTPTSATDTSATGTFATNGPTPASVDADDTGALAERIRELGRGLDAGLSEQIDLLLRFDELEGWHGTGALCTTGWMNQQLGIHPKLAREKLRIGRELRTLPVISAFFRVGKLEWSKVRVLCRVADADNECALAIAALNLGVTGCEAMCRERRHPRTPSEGDLADLVLRAHLERELSWKAIDDESTLIRIRLPNDLAAEFLSGLSHCTDCLYEDERESPGGVGKARSAGERSGADAVVTANTANTAESAESGESAESAESAESVGPTGSTESTEPHTTPTARQRRADAAVLMASRSLALAGDEIAKADRYRVVVDVDARTLGPGVERDGGGNAESADEGAEGIEGIEADTEDSTNDSDESKAEDAADPDALPPRRPVIRGFGPIAVETAKRIACDSGLIAIATDPEGDVLGVGRAMRLLPAKLRRAVEARDKCCSVPGCTATRFLQNHHIVSWMDGGESSVSNTARVCSGCHVKLHEGGYGLERVTASDVELSADAFDGQANDADRDLAKRLVAATSGYRLVPPDRERDTGRGRSATGARATRVASGDATRVARGGSSGRPDGGLA